MSFYILKLLIFLVLPIWIKSCSVGYYGYYDNGLMKCKICDPGYYCDGYYRKICPSGSYCPNPGGNPIPCPAGSYCLIGSIKSQLCPIGSYTNTPSQSWCKKCGLDNINYMCPAAGTTNPIKCDKGSSSFIDAISFMTASSYGASKCVKCPCGQSPNAIVSDKIVAESNYCTDCGIYFDCSNPANPVKCATKNICYGSKCVSLPNCTSSAMCK